MPVRLNRRQFGLGSLALGTSLLAQAAPGQQKSQPVVPGTGLPVAKTGDDFEAEDWTYHPQHPKSSWNIDENVREPGGMSKNLLWVEAAKRGQPDIVRRVATPAGGPEGSKGSMLLQSLYSGVPGRLSGQAHQDDLLHNTVARVGRNIPVSWSPNCVCRVYIVPARDWEERNGASFGYRLGLIGYGRESSNEEYWPGIFIHMERGLKNNERTHTMRLWVRADQHGRDLPSLTFEPETWITLGMSCTPDGACHFYARKGLEDLTAEDNIGSYWCYNYRAHSFQTFFYNVINQDDGRNIGTPWIIDNAMLYAATPPVSKIRGVPEPATTQQSAEKPAPLESQRRVK